MNILCKKHTVWDGYTATCKKIRVGTRVKLRKDVLVRHARSVPPHAGYTKEQFSWRDTLDNLENKTGVVKRIFSDSRHVNVQFGKTLIGIDDSELIIVPKKKGEINGKN